MDKKVFDKAVSLNSKKRCVEELLGRFENQDRTGCDVTVVFTNDRSMKPITDEFRECLKCLLADYEREIEEL
jgi:RNase P protein component